MLSGEGHYARERVAFCRVVVLRPTLGVEVGIGTRIFKAGEVLEGQVVQHPVNAFRKLILKTPSVTFNLNQEDVMVREASPEAPEP